MDSIPLVGFSYPQSGRSCEMHNVCGKSVKENDVAFIDLRVKCIPPEYKKQVTACVITRRGCHVAFVTQDVLDKVGDSLHHLEGRIVNLNGFRANLKITGRV